MPDIRADGIAVYAYRKSTDNPGTYDFLQIHRSKATGEYQQSWQIVYGGIQKSAANPQAYAETALQAALRELKEETSLTPIRMFQVEYLESFYFMPNDYVLVMPVFAVEIAADAQVILNAEHDAHRWIPESQIHEAFMWRTQREALRHVLDALRHPTAARDFLEVREFRQF